MFENWKSDKGEELNFYQVYISYEAENDIKYYGPIYNKAMSIYNDIDDRDNESKSENPSVIIEKIIKIFKYVGDEDKEDYPLIDCFEDSDYYELIDEKESVIIYDKKLRCFNEIEKEENKIFDDIKLSVISYFKNKYKDFIHHTEYAGFLNSTQYFTLLFDKTGNLIDNKNGSMFDVGKNDLSYSHINDHGEEEIRNHISRSRKLKDETLIPIQIRFSNHSQDLLNISEIFFKSLSVVITEHNGSYKKFDHSNDNHLEVIYDNRNDIIEEDITNEIDNFIEETGDDIKK
jgi:hypothetical protein